MKEIPAEKLPRQLLRALDEAVGDLFDQFPPPFDATRMARQSENFQCLMPKGMAVAEVDDIPGYTPQVKFEIPENITRELPQGETRETWSKHMVSEQALQALIEKGKRSGFTDRFKPERQEKVFKGLPRTGLESLDEDYYYILTHWLHMTGHKPVIRRCASLVFGQADLTGFFWYPRNGFMGWHTNENRPGYRFYCVYAREEGKSFFRYWCPVRDELVTSWDKKGWNLRIFRIGVEDERLWHCVYSDTDRLSFGFTVHE